MSNGAVRMGTGGRPKWIWLLIGALVVAGGLLAAGAVLVWSMLKFAIPSGAAGRFPAPVVDAERAARMAAPLPPPRLLLPGVLFYQVAIAHGSQTSFVWIYLPAHPSAAKIPCVLIGPAGSRLFHGMELGEGDRPEHLPYVQAGFAVIAYELDGSLPDNPTGYQTIDAAQEFKDADAGLLDERIALDYALSRVPLIDPGRIYTAGHSSAATLSLLVAEHDPRIKACIAYAPAFDLPAQLGPRFINAVSTAIPGYRDFIQRASPSWDTAALKCPVFLFHADDDSRISTAEFVHCARQIALTNPRVTVVEAPSGGHYESMIDEGIPLAIRWLKHLSEAESDGSHRKVLRHRRTAHR